MVADMKKFALIVSIMLIMVALAGCSQHKNTENNDGISDETPVINQLPDDDTTQTEAPALTHAIDVNFNDYWLDNVYDIEGLLSDCEISLRTKVLDSKEVQSWFLFTNKSGTKCAFLLNGNPANAYMIISYSYDVVDESDMGGQHGHNISAKSAMTCSVGKTYTSASSIKDPVTVMSYTLEREDAKMLIKVFENAMVKGNKDPFVGIAFAPDREPLYFGDPL